MPDFDPKQLRAFLAVVECGGFTAASDVLGIKQSTISTTIAQLEQQIGYRLCERGRAGFSLTPRGEEFHANAIRLAEAIADFEEGARALKGVLAGRLKIALIDNIITDLNCPLRAALASLRDGSRGPRITIDIMTPAQVEHAVAVERVDVGISISEQRLPSLRYLPLYREKEMLFCGRGHPLYNVLEPSQLRDKLRRAAKVQRSFLNHQDFLIVPDQDESIRATVTNVEAAAFLILAGTHIGYMPEHFAKRWVEAGEIRALLPEEMKRERTVSLITQAGNWKSPLLRHFIERLQTNVSPDVSGEPSTRRIRAMAGSSSMAQ